MSTSSPFRPGRRKRPRRNSLDVRMQHDCPLRVLVLAGLFSLGLFQNRGWEVGAEALFEVHHPQLSFSQDSQQGDWILTNLRVIRRPASHTGVIFIRDGGELRLENVPGPGFKQEGHIFIQGTGRIRILNSTFHLAQATSLGSSVVVAKDSDQITFDRGSKFNLKTPSWKNGTYRPKARGCFAPSPSRVRGEAKSGEQSP